MAYANDMIMMAKNERNEEYDERLEEYLKRKGLKVHTEKTKIMRFLEREGKGGKSANGGRRKGSRKCRNLNIWDTHCRQKRGTRGSYKIKNKENSCWNGARMWGIGRGDLGKTGKGEFGYSIN